MKQSEHPAEVFACVNEHAECSNGVQKLRTGGQNRCPFLWQAGTFRKPTNKAFPNLSRFWEGEGAVLGREAASAQRGEEGCSAHASRHARPPSLPTSVTESPAQRCDSERAAD